MAYTFRFATVAEYRAAKASGGVIYNALRPSSSTGSATNVSRSAVSFIAEIGRSVVDAVNVCVPYEQGGYVGDIKCYSPTHGDFWLKVDAAEWSTTSLGQNYFDSTTWPSTFVRIGYVFHRSGNGGLLCAMNGTTAEWSSDTGTTVAGIPTTDKVSAGSIRNYKTWIAGASREIAEAYYGDKMYLYHWPLPRSLWDAACKAAKEGTTGSGSVSDTTTTSGTTYTTSWSSANGVATISVYLYGAGQKSFNPADYDYDFDRWYEENILVPVLGPAGTATATVVNGIRNDGVRNTRIMKATGKSAAADYALSYSAAAPNYGAGMWWIPTIRELVLLSRQALGLIQRGSNIVRGATWSSTQYSSTNAWSVYLNDGYVNSNAKTNTFQVRVVSGFVLKK